jgi:hypothetical protein
MTALIYMVRDSIPKMLYTVKHLPLSFLFFGLLLFFLSIFIASFRLKILLATQNIFLNTADIVKLTFISYFFSSFLPTSVGGDVVKAFYISKVSNKTMQSYTSVFIDRFLGMAAIFLIATCTLFYSKEMSKSYFKWLLPLLLIVSVLFLIFLFNRRLTKMFAFFLAPFIPEKAKEKFRGVYNSMHDFAKYKLQIIECILISIVGQVTAFFAVYIYVLGLNSYIQLKFVLLAMSVASIVSMLPSIYGTGPREMSIVIILNPFIGKDKALAIAFLWLGILFLTALIGGIIYILIGRYKIKLSEVTS